MNHRGAGGQDVVTIVQVKQLMGAAPLPSEDLGDENVEHFGADLGVVGKLKRTRNMIGAGELESSGPIGAPTR